MSNTSALVTLSCFQALASVQGLCSPGRADQAFPLPGMHLLPVPCSRLEVLLQADPGSVSRGGTRHGCLDGGGVGGHVGRVSPHILVLLLPALDRGPRHMGPQQVKGQGRWEGWCSWVWPRPLWSGHCRIPQGPGICWHLLAFAGICTHTVLPLSDCCLRWEPLPPVITTGLLVCSCPPPSQARAPDKAERWLWVPAPPRDGLSDALETQEPAGPTLHPQFSHLESCSPNPLPPWNQP